MSVQVLHKRKIKTNTRSKNLISTLFQIHVKQYIRVSSQQDTPAVKPKTFTGPDEALKFKVQIDGIKARNIPMVPCFSS